MTFKEEIELLEQNNTKETYFYKKGTIPVILTAPHTMEQNLKDMLKMSEPYTKAIAKYVSDKTNCSCFIKIKDTGIDSNKEEIDEFKTELHRLIEENDIKLVIDIHGASKERDFDVELGTLNNLSADFSTIKELEESFIEQGIKNIEVNEPFKGGAITKYIYGNTDIDVIQIEINREYRDIEKIENLEKICKSLIFFIKQYSNIVK